MPRPDPEAPDAAGVAAGAALASGLGGTGATQPQGYALELDHARGADEHGVGNGDVVDRGDGDGDDTGSEDGSGSEGIEGDSGDRWGEDDARCMSRSLLRIRYFQLLEAATAALVAADCTRAAAKMEATHAQARANDAARLAKTHDDDSKSSAIAGGMVSAVGVVVRRLGSASLRLLPPCLCRLVAARPPTRAQQHRAWFARRTRLRSGRRPSRLLFSEPQGFHHLRCTPRRPRRAAARTRSRAR